MKKLNVEDLLNTARERTGLSDFGPDDFMEGLIVLVKGINNEAEIREDRWHPLREKFLRLLINRLWFAKDMKEHPEIADQDVGSPIVITCMPRTGSTKVLRMLGASGDFQVIRLWSGLMFSRIPGFDNGGIAQRIEESRRFEKWMYEVSPEVLVGHPMFTDETDEEWLLGEATFRHLFTSSTFNSPSYAQWLMQADMQPMYEYFLAQLKYLQWQFSPDSKAPWLLKSPCYFGVERYLSTIFDNPRFIVPHRDPAKCIPSITTATMAFRKMYSDSDNTTSFGPEISQVFAKRALDHMRWRDSNPDIQVLDLGFREINEKGMDAVQKVYDYFGMPLSAAAENRMRDWELNNPGGKHGKSTYSAESLGTTESDIRREFEPYIDRYSTFM